jgi:uncharacterized protein YggE
MSEDVFSMRTLLAAALLSAPMPALAQADVPIAGTLLDVDAQGRTTRTPDIATIRAGVVAQAPTAAAALADQAERMARVLQALKRAGVADRDIATATVGLQPQYLYREREAPRITGYQATNSVSVRFRDVKRAGTILDALVASGANQIDGPNLSIDQLDAALDEARLDAMRCARARAELYAKAAGLRVERIVSINEGTTNEDGPRPPIAYARMAAAEAAPTQIAPGEKDVTVSVHVRFLLK